MKSSKKIAFITYIFNHTEHNQSSLSNICQELICIPTCKIGNGSTLQPKVSEHLKVEFVNFDKKSAKNRKCQKH